MAIAEAADPAGGHQVDADLVVDASGRAGQLTRTFRAPAEGGDCGVAYVSRQYQLLPGAQSGPMNSPIGCSLEFDHWCAENIKPWFSDHVYWATRLG
jgi:hypothetical protein